MADAENVTPLLTPDKAAMFEHLDHLFGGYLDGCHDGLVELAWTDPYAGPDGRYKLRHARLFETDQFEELVALAIEKNSQPRTNVYIGAALRLPGTSRDGRTDDGAFYAATALWTDLDDKDANEAAKHRFKAAAPSFVVRTGEYPHHRHQLWWRLTEPIRDPERVRAAVSGICVALSGDAQVVNPGRVMRLAGTIAWDQKEGRRPEVTGIVKLKRPGLPAYVPEHVERAFPPLYSLAHARSTRNTPGPNTGVIRAKDGLGLSTGKVIDGREKHMVAVICAKLIDYCGHFGASPTAEDLFEYAWDAYERDTDLTRSGRGKAEFLDKCRATMRRFEQGKIRGIRSIEEAVTAFETKKKARQENLRAEAESRTSQDGNADGGFANATDLFETLSIPALKALPDAQWIIRDLIVSDGLGFIYGVPGAGKTFVALCLALHIAYGMRTWWWEKEIKRKGLVVYIAREGVSGLKNRIEAWQRHHGIANDEAQFVLIRSNMNFMAADDIAKLVRTIEAETVKYGAAPAFVFVDTVSRVLPGADENLQKEMTLFVAACDALRERFGATVVGVHHAGKSGDMRGSTVLQGAGDFVLKIDKQEDGERLFLHAEKIKDAEDGWSHEIELKPMEWVEDGKIDGERKSRVAVPKGDVDQRPDAGWPAKQTLLAVLSAIRQAWDSGRPWSNAPQSRREGRYAPERMMQILGIERRVAEQIIERWLLNDVLSVETADRKEKVKGLKVIGSIS